MSAARELTSVSANPKFSFTYQIAETLLTTQTSKNKMNIQYTVIIFCGIYIMVKKNITGGGV